MSSPDFIARAKEIENVVVDWRRHFHSHPELSFDEVETSKFIAKTLTEMGCENVEIGTFGHPTGVIADIKGGKSGHCVALRADIDALPVTEETGLAFASQNAGVMHACGHDGHMAMLLGAAKMLCEVRDQLPGTVRLIFQPSEESALVKQGARAVVEDGKALAGVEAIFGVHLWSPLEDGVLGYRPGPMMACSDSWTLNIHGKGGHGASPHETHDPVVAAGQIICALQTFVSRELNPLKNAVISVGIMKAGGAFNVIPGEVELTGTARSFEPQISQDCETFIKRMGDNIGAAFRCTADLDYARNLPPTVNTPEMALMGAEIGKKVFGESCVREIEPTMGGEDFSFYLEKVPGAFFFIGVGDESKGTKWPHHHCRFTIDEAQLCKGSAFEALCAWEFLNK